MANFLTPSEIQSQYLTYLQSIKPSINTNDSNSDFVIRGNVFAGLLSGLYGDQAKVDGDTYFSTARPESLSLHGLDLGIAQQQATSATSNGVTITGTNGTIVNPGDLTLLYVSTGIFYTNTTGGTISGGSLIVSIVSNTTGTIGNVTAPDTLQIVSPPSGINTLATLTVSLADGTDLESTDSYRQRLINRLQQPPAGGNANDYMNFAFAADPSVRTALVRRFGRGLGTVDVYITTGATDIDTAVTQGLPIVRVPGSTLINTVQAYMNQNAPLTDCVGVFGPTENPQNVTIKVDLAANITLSTVPSDSVNNPLGLTVQQLIVREVGRALYKVPVGGWQIPGFSNGFVVASYIEQNIDFWLSSETDTATGLPIGIIPVLADRQVQPLNGSQTNMPLSGNVIVAPGTIAVVLGT